ncbi:MAG: EAL domain-containing protein [bacterium]|nr:EAL domain-containing protein [bacterium]MDY4098967.1 EAL domain-containing protein [Lachnospiraceae bacterium]
MNQVQPKRTLLIVDDQEIDRVILNDFLKKDYQLLTANDGKEALQVLEKKGNELSAVLLDIVMPVMDGFEVLQEMHDNEMLSTVPVLVTSQAEGDDSELKALSLGASDFISKPYNEEILKHRLSNVIKMNEAGKKIDALQRDEITGLYTKVAFADHAAQILHEQTDIEWNMIALDIDRFKLVNESYGQETGDELLAYLAKMLRHYSDTKNCICARSYADHFFLLVERKDYEYIKARHEELMDHLQKFPLDMKIALKFGVYEIHDRDMEIDSMCDRAQIAVNQIKGQYVTEISFYDDSLRKQLLKEQRITDDMELALSDHQFQVYFQPKYDIFSETLSGAEALVRWEHPQNGLISPGEFIPVFESNGFITEVDMFVWDKVCEKIREWLDRFDRFVPISVNVSRRDIYKPNLPQLLVDTVHRHGLEPKHLHLEITESAYVENPEQLLLVVEQLKAAGFIIEMDDFGSGYSSLNMLASMPIDILKLDMKFVQNYSEADNSRSILSFVIGLAKWMNLYVIAEGVETKAQLELLRGMDCNMAQGYYFSKPLQEKEFERVLRQSGKTLEDVNNQSIRFSTAHEGEFQTMLIVDGLAVNRAMLTEYFKNSFSIVEATGGRAALQYLKHIKRADVVMVDAHLPDMEATELIREIKKDPLMDRIPIIVSTHGSGDTVNKVLTAGADAYITKPYSKEQVHECLSRVLSVRGEQMRQEEEEILDKMRMMEMLTTKDYLTGLWNRVELEKRISDHIKHSPDREFYFISIDIDGYKDLITRHGYMTADKVLHEVADRLASCFRDIDVVGRISGDRFAVFLNAAVDPEELLVRMAHLQTQLTFRIDTDIPVTCSCGVSKFPACGRTFDELYQSAEKALDEAKKAGKNCFRLSKKMLHIK